MRCVPGLKAQNCIILKFGECFFSFGVANTSFEFFLKCCTYFEIAGTSAIWPLDN